MNTDLVEQTTSPADVLEKVVIDGDLSKLSSAERMAYYGQVCQSLGLNPMTRPFEYLRLNGKLTLYAKKDATEQLAQKYGISITLDAGHLMEGIYVMKATARMANREVDATGAVSLDALKGEAMANALMKAETKACRRAVLRLVGLGWLDETEVDSVPGATPVAVDHTTGEIMKAKESASNGGTEARQRQRLAAHMKTLGWEWEAFEDKVLGMAWAEWVKMGADTRTAWKRFQKWQGETANAD